jgi:hypothetical protein
MQDGRPLGGSNLGLADRREGGDLLSPAHLPTDLYSPALCPLLFRTRTDGVFCVLAAVSSPFTWLEFADDNPKASGMRERERSRYCAIDVWHRRPHGLHLPLRSGASGNSEAVHRHNAE